MGTIEGLDAFHGTRVARDPNVARTPRRVALILAAIVSLPLLVVLAYSATKSVLPRVTGLKLTLPPNNGTVPPSGYVNATSNAQEKGPLFPSFNLPSLPNLPQINTVDLLLAVTLAIVVVVLFRGLGRKGHTAPFEEDILSDRRRKVASVLDEAARRLNSGSDYRDTVIRCYSLISGLLEEKSDVDGRVLTAREFERRVSEKLMIDSPYLQQVTRLFELARYSEDEITQDQAREAALCLSNLSAPLKEGAIPAIDIK
ncbi:MAG: DUF4129 domain-containing protein [Thaumarchaeota archaeon]|nr:DUF4129 domain-containing protein [Nitrososphaerota archaeon]